MPADAEPVESAGRRRPTPDDMPDLMLAISEGKSLRKACEERGLDPPSTHRFIDDDPAFRQQYARAREMRGEDYGYKVGQVAEKVESGEIAPDVGRVAMDGYKWTAGRMARKNWGDRQQHEHSGPNGAPIAHYDLSKVSDADLDRLEGILGVAVAHAGGDQGGEGAEGGGN